MSSPVANKYRIKQKPDVTGDADPTPREPSEINLFTYEKDPTVFRRNSENQYVPYTADNEAAMNGALAAKGASEINHGIEEEIQRSDSQFMHQAIVESNS